MGLLYCCLQQVTLKFIVNYRESSASQLHGLLVVCLVNLV